MSLSVGEITRKPMSIECLECPLKVGNGEAKEGKGVEADCVELHLIPT